MGFASTYLSERALFPEIIKEAPDKRTGIIVVIPSYNEPNVRKLLDSLIQCREPECKVEVIIVVNAPGDASEEILRNNINTINEIESWKNDNKDCFFRLFPFLAGRADLIHWGVGLARKTGMDEAVRRFNKINNSEGIILNLDADCLIKQDYLASVYEGFAGHKERTACSIYFEHPLSGSDFSENIYRYITLYELHLRYYFQGLAFSGFPYVFHTVGSAIAVKALQYVKVGGMNRRQAGEDFYFIQKLVPSGGYFNLCSTTVYPSPRPSFRVPFGTGASIEKLAADESTTFFTYNLLAFKELRYLFGMTEKIFGCSFDELNEFYKSFPPGLKIFIDAKDWSAKMMEIKNNTSGYQSFRKRFFGWFNMFRIVKYLNTVHNGVFEKKPVDISACELLENLGIIIDSNDPVDLLLCYRKMEKDS